MYDKSSGLWANTAGAAFQFLSEKTDSMEKK